MALEDWAAIAEIIGAVAVIITLIYLATQIRQNTAAIRSSNATTVLINTQQLANLLIVDRELADLMLRAMKDKSGLSPSDKLAVYAWFYNMLKIGELAYRAYVNGELDEEYWNAQLAFYSAYWQTPGFRRYWPNRRDAFIPEFQAAVDKWMDDPSVSVTRPDILYKDA